MHVRLANGFVELLAGAFPDCYTCPSLPHATDQLLPLTLFTNPEVGVPSATLSSPGEQYLNPHVTVVSDLKTMMKVVASPLLQCEAPD